MTGIESIIIITSFLLIVSIGIIMLVLVHQRKQLQYLKDKEQLTMSFEKEILESKLEIQEQTMKNISQEIHDNVGQILTLVKLNLNTMTCEAPNKLYEKINNSSELVGKAIQDLRDLSKSLHTDFITEMGLVKSIEYEFEMIKKAGNYKTVLIIEGEPSELPNHHELILFRMFQEVLNNIIKHAKATSVTAKLCFENDNLRMEISDDGAGFNVPSVLANGTNGLGIKNMYNRAKMIGATFNITSEPHRGTHTEIFLPGI